jgi:hypothetical protein
MTTETRFMADAETRFTSTSRVRAYRARRRRGIEGLPIRVTQAQLRAIEDKGYLAGHSLADKVEARSQNITNP